MRVLTFIICCVCLLPFLILKVGCGILIDVTPDHRLSIYTSILTCGLLCILYISYSCLAVKMQEKVGRPSETDSIKSQISSKTSRGKKGSIKRRHQILYPATAR